MTDRTVAMPIIIKRYARSRLYEPGRGRYVSMDTLCAWQAKAIAFIVVDSETGEDVTRVLLA
jgi:polyhydroxyalkanoate synthesis regulator protein